MKQLCITAIFLLLPIWSTEIEIFMSDQFIQFINITQKDWTAERYFSSNLTLDSLKRLTGIKEVNKSEVRMARIKSFENSTIPEHFDARDNWPFCKNVTNEIRNQGFCASSWAFSAAQVVADRTCIQSNGTIKFQYAPGDLVHCCDSCGGCNGIENLIDVWEFLQNTGVVSGGDYQERYIREIASKPHSKSSFNRAAITCNKSCRVSNQVNNELDKRCIESYDTIIADIQEIQKEIMTNGPVQAVFDVYADFLHYKSGVYYHLSHLSDTLIPLIGKHAVQILGWGEENGKNYWLAANSWGSGWGDQGTFKILRGECGIEDNIIWPKVETTATTTTTQSTATPIKITTTTTAPTTPPSNTTTTTTPTAGPTTSATTTTTITEKTTSTSPPHSDAIDVKDFTCRFLVFSSLLYLL